MGKRGSKWRRIQGAAIDLRAGGMDLRGIAKRLGVSFGTVHRALHDADCIDPAAARIASQIRLAQPIPLRSRPLAYNPAWAPQAGDVTTERTVDGASVSDTRHPDGTRTVSITGDMLDPDGRRITSLEALLERFGIDPSQWVVTTAKVKTYEAFRKNKQDDLTWKDGVLTGTSRDHGGLHVQPLYSVTATLARHPEALARERMDALVSEYAKRLATAAPPEPSNIVRLPAAPATASALLINAADIHFGKYANGRQTGQAYDRSDAARLATAAVDRLLIDARRLAPVGRVILALNGDLSHIDNKHRTTTKGTPQDTDGTALEVMLGALELARHLTAQCRRVAPTEVHVTFGNHDEMFSALLRRHLADVFSGADGVSVQMHERRTSMTRVGSTLIVLEHGDNFQAKGYGATLLSEARDVLAGVQHIEVITGHGHHHNERDYGGFVHRQGMSISGTDVWHDERHYRARRGMSAYLVDPQHGITATLTAPVTLLDEPDRDPATSAVVARREEEAA